MFDEIEQTEAGNSLVPTLPPDPDPNPNSPRGGGRDPGTRLRLQLPRKLSQSPIHTVQSCIGHTECFGRTPVYGPIGHVHRFYSDYPSTYRFRTLKNIPIIHSTSTPPGTKVRLVGTMAVQNSFILLKKTSVEVLGGSVEHLVKKWNMQKASVT